MRKKIHVDDRRNTSRVLTFRIWFLGSEALINIRCSGDGEWVDSRGNLLYVDDSRKGGQVQVFLQNMSLSLCLHVSLPLSVLVSVLVRDKCVCVCVCVRLSLSLSLLLSLC